MSYETYKGYRLAPSLNGCWDVLNSNYEKQGTFPSKVAAKRHIDEEDMAGSHTPTPDNESELDEALKDFAVQIHLTLPGEDETAYFEQARQALLFWRNKAIDSAVVEAERQALAPIRQWVDNYDTSKTIASLNMLVYAEEQRILATLKERSNHEA